MQCVVKSPVLIRVPALKIPLQKFNAGNTGVNASTSINISSIIRVLALKSTNYPSTSIK